MSAQIVEKNENRGGGFFVNGRNKLGSGATATRAEGLLAAHRVLRKTDPALAQRVLLAAKRAMGFILRHQLNAKNTKHLPDPKRAMGGFRRNFSDYEIRIDYVQHSLSAILALLGSLN